MGIIIKPIVTEKMTRISEKYNRFAFCVDRVSHATRLYYHAFKTLSTTFFTFLFFLSRRGIKYHHRNFQNNQWSSILTLSLRFCKM